jgi:hypothetical protein
MRLCGGERDGYNGIGVAGAGMCLSGDAGGGVMDNRSSQATMCYSPPRAMACLPFIRMLTVLSDE